MLRAARGVVPSARQQVFSRATPAAYGQIACQQQSRSAHAISNPELANIEKRWEEMPPQEQADLWMALRDRMKAPWTELTIQEKKAGTLAPDLIHDVICIHPGAIRRNLLNIALPASPAARFVQQSSCLALMARLTPTTAYHIAFGPHGPRAEAPPGEGMKIFNYTMIGVAVSIALFYFTRVFARGPPKTMSQEWQEASNAYLKVRLRSVILMIANSAMLVTSE